MYVHLTGNQDDAEGVTGLVDRALRSIRASTIALRPDRTGYVFGIGFAKTGTTSLHRALDVLGYKSAHWDYTKRSVKYDIFMQPYYNPNLVLSKYNAFMDLPIARIYKNLDKMFRHSSFILTTRDENDWYESHYNLEATHGHKFNGQLERRINLDMYGSIEPDRGKNIAAFKAHHGAVVQHFCQRMDQLLILDIIGGDGWRELCTFLDKRIPVAEFPKENVSRS